MRAALLLLALLPAGAAAADCSSPPATWGKDWSAYESWCRGCCGTFVRSGTQSRCDPGPNWGCRGAGGSAGTVGTPAPPAVPKTMEGAVLQGVQSGIQKGLQDARERRRRQQAENDRQLQRTLEESAAIEADALETAAELERLRKADAEKARASSERKARSKAESMRGLGRPSAPLAPKDLARPGRPKTSPSAAALDCLTAAALGGAEALGPAGKDLARGLRSELAGVLAGLRARPPSGTAGAVTTVSVGRDQAVAGPDGESQVVVSVLVTRDESSGELRLSVLSSVSGPSGPGQETQGLAVLDRAGRPSAYEGPPDAEACLGRLAR